MVRKERKRISYVLPLAKSAGGHRLGVNGLAVDPNNSILYSGGRDGVICAWDLNLELDPFADDASSQRQQPAEGASKNGPATTFRQQVQAHTHWINDIVLAENNQALVSASSDITVKVWRPAAEDVLPPQTIGLHSDYVKCLASPGPQATWVASGGLDRKICLWDLEGQGERLKIHVGEDDSTAKGSVYALAVTPNVLASGGPESIVRVWDPRSGKRITKFVGHTDNIRDVLIAQDGDTIMTASSDQTVKVWSMTAGRCMYTLTMHNDSVWSIASDHPRLSVFYSSDRSGLVAKTDARGCNEMDEGMSVAICQEHEGVNKVIHAGDYVWTSTSSSSINRWNDVDTESEVQVPEALKAHRASIATARTKASLSAPTADPQRSGSQQGQIPFRSLLRVSNAAPFHMYPNRDADTTTLYSNVSARKPSETLPEIDTGGTVPVRALPDHTIEGQNGLIKHIMLNDRRRVLTLDTAGEVMMWDLIQCAPIKSFGKRHMEDVLPEVNITETVAHWCAVDTRTGSLTCVLEENYCFDAEMYADELQLDEQIEFREDQRINLGKWILRYLFANLIDEEIRRDEAFRKQLIAEKGQAILRENAPGSIELPGQGLNTWPEGASTPTSATTVKPTNGANRPNTPGMGIGLATPGPMPMAAHSNQAGVPTGEENSQSAKPSTRGGAGTPAGEKQGDYFSAAPTGQQNPVTPGNQTNGHGGTAAESHDENTTASPTDAGKKKSPAVFGKKFRMDMSFGMKKLARTTTAEANKPTPAPATEEKSEDSDSRSSTTEHRTFEDNFLGCVQRIRQGYEDHIQEAKDREPGTSVTMQSMGSAVNPSLPNETPVIKPPTATTILIQEDRPGSGGVADLFEGTVGSLGGQADLIEKVAPMWLGDVLLRNQVPMKDIVKVAFILEPWQNQLPAIASDGYDTFQIYLSMGLTKPNSNNRLNANRMLRARKVLAYVAERIEPQPAKPEPNAMRPEEYLELYCQNQVSIDNQFWSP
ncbi:WD repeat protein-like protein [Rhizodiscina lignyota]|uniref:WD repeat protein-like protein n=1 Tax=Rhizodiscina lignyota TaxID=1504668 RepID=A0A9P4I7I0_9PEZI|nr:WD repeat protein-like protein [Rhizodiscina lignyota]